MFVDRVKIFVKGGDGGRGCVSFRREPFQPRGGPDGGNGGHGGDVLFVANPERNTLLALRPNSEHRAPGGRHGGSNNKTGASGEELRIDVPRGTTVYDDESGTLIGEVLAAGERLVVASGGLGGRGNRAFLSNRNRAPREAQPGIPGEEHHLRLELKLLADVGLLGLPNAGKSTLLAHVSRARPKVADYPFTTLTPVLGLVGVDDSSFVAADIPGIIEGAHEGAGLGLQFLRHVERTRVLLHVVDTSSGADPVAALGTQLAEVEAWKPDMLTRPQLIAATKRDLAGDADPLPALEAEARRRDLVVVPVSAVTGAGLLELKRKCVALLEATPDGIDQPL